MKDKLVYKGNNLVGALMNVPIFVRTFSVVMDFAVLEDMDAYRDKGMGDVIVGQPFLKEVGIKARQLDGMVTIYNGNDEVTYQIVRSHPRFKHHTNVQCNEIPPLLKSRKSLAKKQTNWFDQNLGRSYVPPPLTQVYSPPKKDLSWMGLPEFVDDTVTDYSRPTPSVDVSKDVSASSLEQGGSFDNVVSKPMIRFVKETGCPSVSKDNNTEKPTKPTVKYAEMYRNTSQSPKVMSSNFGPPIIEDWDSKDESEVKSIPNKTDRPSIEQVKMNQSTREIVEMKESSKQNKTKFSIVGSKVPTAKPTVAAVKGNRGKAVKASACWIWKPKQNQLDQSLNLNGVLGIPHDNIDMGRVETMDGETKIIANFNDKQRTVTESSMRRHLKLLNDEEFFLKMGQFGVIKHTETYDVPFHTQKVFTTLRVNSPSFSGRTVQLFESMLVPQGEGSENPTEPHHTPSAQYESTPQEDQTTSPEPIPQATTLPSQSHPDISTPRRLTRGAIRISQSKAPTPGADETASPIRDDRHEEAFPTATSLDAGQDRENIAKTSAMPREASPGGYFSWWWIQSQDLEMTHLKNKVKTLKDNEKRIVGFAQEDALNTGGMGQREDLMIGDVKKSTGKGSDNTDETTNVLSTLEVANVLCSGSFPTIAPAGVATTSGSFPTAVIFTTASVTTPYTRRKRSSRGIIIEPSHTTSVPTISAKGKGKEKMVESIGTKKKKIPEQLDAQVAKELEMELPGKNS
ncbi:hypothetical protein Tco_0011576 [Tanacetum coccineum]